MLFFSLLVVSFGSFLFFRPASAIEAQRRLYACFNWRLEPISAPKAILSIKFMGLFVTVIALAALAYFIK